MSYWDETAAERYQTGRCIACGEPLPEDASILREFCDGTCRKRYSRRRPPGRPRFCAWCGIDITSRRPQATTCSDACRKKRSKSRIAYRKASGVDAD